MDEIVLRRKTNARKLARTPPLNLPLSFRLFEEQNEDAVTKDLTRLVGSIHRRWIVRCVSANPLVVLLGGEGASTRPHEGQDTNDCM